jgi:hypothetical protein
MASRRTRPLEVEEAPRASHYRCTLSVRYTVIGALFGVDTSRRRSTATASHYQFEWANLHSPCSRR